MVSRLAQKIERMVETSADWDAIDASIEELENACAIDDFVDGQASSRLGPLRKLRETKEGDVESEVALLIDRDDYEGIGSLIGPLAESPDLLKRQKFHRYEVQIFAALDERIQFVKTSLSSTTRLTPEIVTKVAKSIAVLRTADSEIGPFVARSLRTDVKDLKDVVSQRFQTFLRNFSEAKQSFDVTRMAIAMSRATQFASCLGDEAPPDAIKDVRDIHRVYDDYLRSVEREIELFFENGFRNGPEVIKLLSSLERGASSSSPVSHDLSVAYRRRTEAIKDHLLTALEDIRNDVSERQSFEDGVVILQSIVNALDGGLSKHVDVSNLPYDCRMKLEEWRAAAEKLDGSLALDGANVEETIRKLGKRLDGLRRKKGLARNRLFGTFLAGSDRTYEKLVREIQQKLNRIESLATACLRTTDTVGLQRYIKTLRLLDLHVRKHVPAALEALERVEENTSARFEEILVAAVAALSKGNLTGFENVFAGIRSFVLDVPLVTERDHPVQRFRMVNKLILESIRTKIQSMMSMIELKSADVDFMSVDFLAVRAAVEETRIVGDFVADHCTLFFAEMAAAAHLAEDPSLAKIMVLCRQHFSDGRSSFKNILHCAILGVVPSADEKEIKRAFRSKASIHYPDKTVQSSGDNFRKIKEAEDALLDAVSSRASTPKRAFDQDIRQMRIHIVDKAKKYMQEQRYGAVDHILSRLPGLREIKDLIDPKFEDVATRDEVHRLVRDYVQKAKTEVRSLWSERKYRDLNDTINDLKAMEASLKCHPEVFPASWNEGILEDIEDETKKLARDCRKYLTSQASAKVNEGEFRRDFLQLGCILVELPSMKNATKAIMTDVLEYGLREEWGFGYLFELGLSLQRGEDKDDETEHVAHLILSEFSHFKEVLTMAWNTETVQKPVEDTVKHIRAESLNPPAKVINIDESALLSSFDEFEVEYKAALGEFIRPESDRSELVRRVIETCKLLRKNCTVDKWGQEIRESIPKILGGIFALFTICKSGESFNRIEASNASSNLGMQVLMKPHNIQVLTLLYMFGCNEQSGHSLDSQLLQIRTGEGKSMILGAAATVLGLLGFRVRCVCYSDYLSKRDYESFLPVFREFGLDESIVYCKITQLSEEMVSRKGDIRSLTTDLLLERLAKTHGAPGKVIQRPKDSKVLAQDKKSIQDSCASSEFEILLPEQTSVKEEILLVDEVDVFFGSDFYGQTYNQVTQIREPEVRDILELIWKSHKQGRSLQLSDIVKTQAYSTLIVKMKAFVYVVDKEISFMLDAVQHVDDEPYFLDPEDRIGYKVMDSISYDVTIGYRTVFAYLKENDRGKLRDPIATLDKALCMHVSCGQFSYANVSPSRILGVSGTLSAMGTYEKSILQKYGISKFVFLPSVYGPSNFQFDKAGDGVCIETNKSDLYQRLQQEIARCISASRAVIVFFADAGELAAFENSPYFRQLGRKRAVLSEDKDSADKDYTIKKASTAGQVTICSAVFGRGTDFFCKDQKVEENGGVHVIQTFLSPALSEEVQIQGRTARQGKAGTYQLVLLESDLQSQFGISPGFRDAFPKKDWYRELFRMRDSSYEELCDELESNLEEADIRDQRTHEYFDALLVHDVSRAGDIFKEIYSSMKKGSMPSSIDIDLCFVVDVTGSMRRYMKATNDTIDSLLSGSRSIMTRLKGAFPDIEEFKLRIGATAFRDLDDGSDQFYETLFADGSHFTDDVSEALRAISDLTDDPSGGYDVAEDILGAIHHCIDWTCWSSTIKLMILVTDAPAHGLVGAGFVGSVDTFPHVHPNGHTVTSVADSLVENGIDLALCSFNPAATERTEEELSKHYLEHQGNVHGREIIRIPMISTNERGAPPGIGDRSQHIVFVLDDSGSMCNNWSGVEAAYRMFCARRLESQCSSDLVSVVQFDDTAMVAFREADISKASISLSFRGGGTYYTPAAQEAQALVVGTPSSHEPVVIFMSDGYADESDALYTAQIFSNLNVSVRQNWGTDLELHVVAFGQGLDTRQLTHIMSSSARGQVHSSANVAQLGQIFLEIAKSSSDVAGTLESEIGRRISEAVSDKISLEYIA